MKSDLTIFKIIFGISILLLALLTACNNIQTLPTEPYSSIEPTNTIKVSTELVIDPTDKRTEESEPVITATPDQVENIEEIIAEATPTPEVQILDFEVPVAPQGIDETLWQDAYISAFTTKPDMRNWVEAGLTSPKWDSGLNTIVWEYGETKYAYNTEFGFTGDVVGDKYGGKWIVREKLTSSQGQAASIWQFESLHVSGKSEIVMGVECHGLSSLEEYLDTCGIVGQVIGKEKIDLSSYLINDFDQLTAEEAGIFYGRENLVFEAIKVLVPSINGNIEIVVPVSSVGEYGDKDQIASAVGPSGTIVSGKDVLDKIELGSMIYLYDILMKNGSGDFVEGTKKTLQDYKEEDPVAMSFMDAFGYGDILSAILRKHFNVTNLDEKYLSAPTGAPMIFDVDKMAEDNMSSIIKTFLSK